MRSCPVSLKESPTCAEAVRLSRLEFTIQFSSLALIYFDYTLSLKDEIQYIWMQRWRLSTLFYVFCRYSLISNVLYVLAISEDVPGLDCSVGYILCGSLSILGHIGVISIWTLRTSAVYNNSTWVLAVLGSMGTVVVILLIIRTPYLRCSGGKDMSILLGANLALLTTLEVVSFLMAAYRVWKTMKESQKHAESKVMSLNQVILQQGILYIFAVVLLHSIALILNFKERTGLLSRLINGLKLPLTGALSARFMLRLRACDTQKRLHPDLSFVDAAFAALERQSILEEFQSDIGTSAYDVGDDIDPLSTPNTIDTGASTLSSRRGSEVDEPLELQEFVEGSSTGPASADLRKLKQRKNGMPPDLEGGLYSPPASASAIVI